MWIDRFLEFIPGPLDLLLGSLVAVIMLGSVIPIVVSCHGRGWRIGDTRKLFHFLIFSGAGALRYFGSIAMVAVYGSWVALTVLLSVRRGSRSSLFQALARPEDQDARGFNVLLSTLSTALGGVAAHLLLGKLALVSYLVTGCGDALGEPIGIRFGRHPLPLRLPGLGRRTWEGSAAVFCASALSAALALNLCGVSLERLSLAAFMVAAVATLTEALSPRGSDNFTIQIAVALTLLALGL